MLIIVMSIIMLLIVLLIVVMIFLDFDGIGHAVSRSLGKHASDIKNSCVDFFDKKMSDFLCYYIVHVSYCV